MSLIAVEKPTSNTKLETVACDLCGSSEYGLKFTARNTEFNQPFNLVECHGCGLVYLNPRPTRAAIDRYYPAENYYAYQNLDSKEWDNFRQRVKNFIWECQPGYSENLAWLRKTIWSWFKKNLMIQIPYQKNGRVLDVGCGNGYFLKWMQDHGWEGHGVEISEAACQVAQKNDIRIFNGELREAKYPADYFDVVIMNQVLEHVYSPRSYFREIRRVLKPGGLSIACVPNFNSYESRVFGSHWLALEVPRHLYFFTPAALTSLARDEGFRIERLASKSFGLPWSGITKSIREAVRQQIGNKPGWKAVAKATGYLARLTILKPIRYWMAESKENFGFFISLYARKK